MHIPESLQDLADSEAVQFLKRPKTIARIFAGVFSLVVFSSLLTDGHQNNTNSTACGFAVGAGLLAFLTCLAFLALDTHESRIGSSHFKTAGQLLDSSWLVTPAPALLWTGIWFVGFSASWPTSCSTHPPKGSSWEQQRQGPITFTLLSFSVLVWVSWGGALLKAGPTWPSGTLRNDAPVPYKRSLDEGSVALTTLSPPSAASPVNTPPAGPNSLNYASSALIPLPGHTEGPPASL
uniref:Synaptogyrin 4 n=1 Tax=Lynx canadensis TaxID=61383 RepID=A0A667IS48_LYNCA